MRLPDDTNRVTIVGRTGSGKTVAGIWHLSLRRYDLMPWVIVDYKRDQLINRLPTTEIELKGGVYKPPTKPGLYVIRPHMQDEGAVEDLLWKIRYQGNTGVYIDEGYMLPMSGKSEAFTSILTQGRSLRIPTITLSQRPVWLGRFVITEASFLQVFWLNDKRDRQTLTNVIPAQVQERLPEYHSYYYDVSADKLDRLKPVPREDEIVATFRPIGVKSRGFSFI